MAWKPYWTTRPIKNSAPITNRLCPADAVESNQYRDRPLGFSDEDSWAAGAEPNRDPHSTSGNSSAIRHNDRATWKPDG